MPVFRVEKNRNYTVMSNHHLKDRNLSLKGKGLLSVILSLPDDWSYTTRGLAAISKEGVDSIGAALKELEAVGYLTRNRLRNERGQITDTEYVVYEYPQNSPDASLPDVGLPDTASPKTVLPYTAPPDTENPYMDNPDTGIPYTGNPAQLKTNKALKATKESSTIKQKHPCVSGNNAGQLSLEDTANPHQQAECLSVQMANGTGKPANHTMTLVDEHEQQFEQFWRLYPRKAGKKAAKKAWTSIKPNEILFSAIIAAITTANQYWKHQGISLKHIPHPSTWLNEERWEDEYSAEQLTSHVGIVPDESGNSKGGVHNAAIGTNYSIGGDDDPYRELMPD